ncbi:MAG: acetyl-CoA carboxylase biotin carboxyl carrier protein [Deltaproteobacteria bacterium]|nr:acetyl-CoA carboxylase biotin carboxyl carrier protein [Deltaproteobacteria bacterium]
MTAPRPKTDRSPSRPASRSGAPTSAAASAPAPAGASAALDLRFIREVAKVLAQYRLTEISLEFGGGRIRLRRGGEAGQPVLAHPSPGAAASGLAAAAPAPTAAPTTPAADAGVVEITSPFVGTFYRGPSPEAPPYVEVGSRIRAGQVLCIVEAMKLMNEIESEAAGTVVEVLGQSGQPVEYGEALFKVRVE